MILSFRNKAGLTVIMAIISLILIALPASAHEPPKWNSLTVGNLTVQYGDGISELDARRHAVEMNRSLEFLQSCGVSVYRGYPYHDALVSSWPQYLDAWGRGAEPIPWYGPDANHYVTSVMTLVLMPYSNYCNMVALERYYETRMRGGDPHRIAEAVHRSAPYLRVEDFVTGTRTDATAQEIVWMGASLLAFIDERFGTPKLLSFTQNLVTVSDFEETASSVLGVSAGELERQWLQYLAVRTAKAPAFDEKRFTDCLIRYIHLAPETNLMLFDAAGVGYKKDRILKLYRKVVDLSTTTDLDAFEKALNEYTTALSWARWGRRLSIILPIVAAFAILMAVYIRNRWQTQKAVEAFEARFASANLREQDPGTPGSAPQNPRGV